MSDKIAGLEEAIWSVLQQLPHRDFWAIAQKISDAIDLLREAERDLNKLTRRHTP